MQVSFLFTSSNRVFFFLMIRKKNLFFLSLPFFVGGQLHLGFYQFDGALRINTGDGIPVLYLVNYHSGFCHGCEDGCSNPLPQYAYRVQASRATDQRIKRFLSSLSLVLKLDIVYSVITDCPSHTQEPSENSPDRILGEPRIISYSGMDT